MVTKFKELYIRIRLVIAMWRYFRARQRFDLAMAKLIRSVEEMGETAEATSIVVDFFGKAAEDTETLE